MSEEIKKDPFELTIKINFGDMEIDEEDCGATIAKKLQHEVIREAINTLRELSIHHINKILSEQFNETIPRLVESMVQARLEVLQQTQKLKFSQYAGDSEISIEEFIIKKLQNQRLDDMLKGFVDIRAKELGAQLKSHYDIAFANQLVQKLNENGLLLPDVAKRLLDK